MRESVGHILVDLHSLHSCCEWRNVEHLSSRHVWEETPWLGSHPQCRMHLLGRGVELKVHVLVDSQDSLAVSLSILGLFSMKVLSSSRVSANQREWISLHPGR